MFQTAEYEGFPAGMNLALPKQALDDLECRYIQDCLLDYPSKTRRRGPVRTVPNIGALSRKAAGIAGTVDMTGVYRVGVLTGNDTNGYFSVYDGTLSSVVDLTWPHSIDVTPPSNPFTLTDCKPSLTGGSLIGTSALYADTAEQGLAFWRGGNKANYTTGTLSVSRGATSVTGSGTSWSANVVPGMFLFANTDEPYTNTYIGIVQSVNSNTSITLATPSPYAITAKAYTLQSLRGFQPIVATGRITFDSASTTVTGGQTKFATQLNTGTWQIYRASDWVYIGKVSSIQTNLSLTLTANAAISGYNERYIAIRADGDWGISTTTTDTDKPGFVTSTYAERQWYANNGSDYALTYRVWYSDPNAPEIVDFSPYDGSFFDIGDTSGANSPIKALASAYNGLVVLKENEAFIVTGSSPSTFSPRKLWDDGCFSGMSVQQYGGGVIWAGRDGIHFYDGTTVHNLTDLKLGNFYKNAVKNADPNIYRMYSMLTRDHYFLFIEEADPEVSPIKGTTTTALTKLILCINLQTRAVSTHTNLNFRGMISLPADTGIHAWFVSNSSTIGKVCDADYLFDTTGNDDFAADGGTAGPDLYIESKAYDFGASLRMKKIIRLTLNYLVSGDSLKVDLVEGLNDAGSTLANVLATTSYTWTTLDDIYTTWSSLGGTYATWAAMSTELAAPQVLFFDRRTTHIGFRIWQNSASVTDAEISLFSWAFKPMRQGRVA